MMKLLVRSRLFAAVAGAVGVMLVGGIAWATIPDPQGVIHGCYINRLGTLRVIDTNAGQQCSTFESSISWNAQGPKGDPGAKGDPGEKGDRGPAGPSEGFSYASATSPSGYPLGDSVAHLDVPPGSYIVNAKAMIGAQGTVLADCVLVAGDDQDRSQIVVEQVDNSRDAGTTVATIPFSLAHRFDGAGAIDLRCSGHFQQSGNSASLRVTDVKINAIQVETLTN